METQKDLPKPLTDLLLPEKRLSEYAAPASQGDALRGYRSVLKSKFFLGFVLISTFIAFIAGGFLLSNKSSVKRVACTQEAKICPDGTSVSRTGPNCEFPKCPSIDKKEGIIYCGETKTCPNGYSCNRCFGANPKSGPTTDPKKICVCVKNSSPTPNPTTASWKTYTNSSYSFSIKYPEDFTATETNADSAGIRTELAEIRRNDHSFPTLNIYLFPNPQNLSAVDFIKTLPDYEGGKFVKPLPEQPSYFSSMDAVKANGFGGAGNTGNQAFISDKKGHIFDLFTSDLDEATIDRLFSTFKFTN